MTIFTKMTFSSLVFFLCFAANLSAAVITVDTNQDGAVSTDLCQLRDAIAAANSNMAVDGCAAGDTGEDVIQFSPLVNYIFLDAALPFIAESLTIAGPGPDSLTIDGDDAHITLSTVGFPTTVENLTIRGVTLFQGLADKGGCLFADVTGRVLVENTVIDSCEGTNGGGGLYLLTTREEGSDVLLRNMTVVNNRTNQSGGGLLVNTFEAVVEDSVFFLNRAQTGGAIAVAQITDFTASRSTFWGNKSVNGGSAIDSVSASTLVRIEHSTFSQNETTGVTKTQGATIRILSTFTLFNNVIAGNLEINPNFDSVDIFVAAGGTLISEGFNFVGSNEGATTQLPAGIQANGDQIGTKATPLNPNLDDLQDNGGVSWTSLPLNGSPLIDAGSCPGEATDQRGYQNQMTLLRIIDNDGVEDTDDGCDIGATEYLAQPPQVMHEDGFETPIN